MSRDVHNLEMNHWGVAANRILLRRINGGLRCGRQHASVLRRVSADRRFANKNVSEISDDDCAGLLGDMERAGLSPRTRRNTRSLMSSLMSDCVREGLITRNPVPAMPGLDVDADPWWRDMQRFDPVEISELVYSNKVDALRRAAWRFRFTTGLRSSEYGGASWGDLDLKKKPFPLLRVVQAWNTCDRELRETKTRAPRGVALNDDAQAALQTLADLWPIVAGRPFTNEDPIHPVTKYRGESKTPLRKPRKVRRLRNDTAWHWLQEDLEAVGLRRRGTHAFRASVISTLLEAGVTETMVLAVTHPRQSGGDRVLRGYFRPKHEALCEIMKLIRIPSPVEVGQMRLPFT